MKSAKEDRVQGLLCFLKKMASEDLAKSRNITKWVDTAKAAHALEPDPRFDEFISEHQEFPQAA